MFQNLQEAQLGFVEVTLLNECTFNFCNESESSRGVWGNAPPENFKS